MLIGKMFPSKYLKAADIGSAGVRWTIKLATNEKMVDGESKWVLYFQEDTRGLVLNKTNSQLIGRQHGDDSDDWPGKQVVLRVVVVDFKGVPTPAIRVVLPPASSAAPPSTAAPTAPVVPPAPSGAASAASVVHPAFDDTIPL
jgi:hypothetical protein